MSPHELPTGDAAAQLALAHLFVTTPMRLETPRPTEYGQPPNRVLIAGVSIDGHGWLFAWAAYLPSADTPMPSVWPAAQGASFDAVLPAMAEVELIARVDTPERAVARLQHHLKMLVRARIGPDMDYLRRAVAAYRADLRRARDQAAAWERLNDQP